MIRTHRALTVRLVGALLACLLVPLSAARAAESTVSYVHESVQSYEKQLAAGEIKEATFNKRARNLHLTLTNGQHMLVHYPPKQEQRLASQLRAKGVSVSFLTAAQAKAEAKKKPVHHKIRYIVGGIVIAIIVVVAIVLLVDRRRKRLGE
jgi:hypothetical protein